jgi:hypothetical protein
VILLSVKYLQKIVPDFDETTIRVLFTACETATTENYRILIFNHGLIAIYSGDEALLLKR